MTQARAMQAAIRRCEWERIALALLLALAEAAPRAPRGEIEDLLAALDGELWDGRDGTPDVEERGIRKQEPGL